MTEPSISQIFTSLLLFVPATVADKYAEGMRAYHAAFTRCRDAAMNYEDLPDYLNTQATIMELPKDQFWPFCPSFRKCVCRTLQELFKTKIVAFGMCPVSLDQHLVFVDDHGHRWIMSVVESPRDPEGMNLIYMHYPRSNTPMCKCSSTAQLTLLKDSAMASSGRSLVVCDTAGWNDSPAPA